MVRRRLGLVAAWAVVLMAAGCDTQRLPPDPIEVKPTLIVDSSFRFDQRSISWLGPDGVIFYDPASGDRSGIVRTPKGPPGSDDIQINRWTIVDTPDDTYVVFLLQIMYPQDGLTPQTSEFWIYTVSRNSGATVYERRIDLPQDRFSVVFDRTGTAVFTLGVGNRLEVVAVPFLPGRASWSRQPEERSGDDWRVLGAADGVVLLWRESSADFLYGIDAASGTTVWGQRLPNVSGRHGPKCVVRHGDRFVIIGEDWPLVVGIRDGRLPTTQSADDGCDMIDPLGEAMVDPRQSINAYDLTDGHRLWSMTYDQARELGLEVVGIHDGRVYVETDRQRLVLDARTGQEVGAGWVVFPVELHDGWILARHMSYARPVVYPGSELPTPPTASASAPPA